MLLPKQTWIWCRCILGTAEHAKTFCSKTISLQGYLKKWHHTAGIMVMLMSHTHTQNLYCFRATGWPTLMGCCTCNHYRETMEISSTFRMVWGNPLPPYNPLKKLSPFLSNNAGLGKGKGERDFQPRMMTVALPAFLCKHDGGKGEVGGC